MIDTLDVQVAPIDKQLRAYGRRQPGCRALMAHYGIGHLTAVTILAELGDARRFCSSRDAVRYAGLDITVKQSDRRRAPGHLSRQGPPALRWALYEAAQSARRQSSPDRDYYRQAAERLGGNRACLAVARKLLKRSYHTPRELGDQPLQPARPPRLARAALTHTDAPRPAPGIVLPPRPRGRPPTTERPHSPTQREPPPSTITSPARHTAGSRTEIRPGARAHHNTHTAKRAAPRPQPRRRA